MFPCVVLLLISEVDTFLFIYFLSGKVFSLDCWGTKRGLGEFYKILIMSDVFKLMMLVGWSASQSIKEMSSVILEEMCFKTIHA